MIPTTSISSMSVKPRTLRRCIEVRPWQLPGAGVKAAEVHTRPHLQTPLWMA
jgi:hypothetical protein